MEHTTYRGQIAYIGDDAGKRGHEWFTTTRHSNGHRTLRAISEIYDSKVLRDATVTVDQKFRPLDAFIRLTVNEQFMGSGWFRFTDTEAECETFMAEGGRVSQRIAVKHHPPFFGAHPVANDCWVGGSLDRTTPNTVLLEGGMMSSLLPNGASGPMLSPMTLRTQYVGLESVTVPAGTFEAYHFRFLVDDMAAEDVWCYGDDLIFVKIRWDQLKTTYELLELKQT